MTGWCGAETGPGTSVSDHQCPVYHLHHLQRHLASETTLLQNLPATNSPIAVLVFMPKVPEQKCLKIFKKKDVMEQQLVIRIFFSKSKSNLLYCKYSTCFC